MPLIRQYAAEDARHPLIRSVASRYRAAMPGAHTSEIAWRAARNHLTFVDDQSIAASAAPGIGDAIIEVLRRPADVAYQYQMTGERVPGDCDDHSMFSAAVARALDPDIDIRFVCIAASPSEPGVLSHIYVSIGGVPCDASHGEYPGWEAPAERVSRRVEYSIDHHIGVMALIALVAAVAWYTMRWASPPLRLFS
jgi:hypothetical protein